MATEKRFTLDVERSDAGLWYVSSPELKHSLFAGLTLYSALTAAANGLADMLDAMRQAKANGEPCPEEKLAKFEAALR